MISGKRNVFLAVIVASLVLAERAFTEEKLPASSSANSLKTHNFGFAAGFVSGYGLTYRHWGMSGNGYQLTFIPVLRFTEEQTFFNSSVGAMGLRALHLTRNTNFYAYYGAQYNYTYDNNAYSSYYYDGNNNIVPTTYKDLELVHNVYAGGGLGIELHFWNLNYTLMFGYAGNARREFRTNAGWAPSLQFQPTVETALFYCF